MSSRTSLALALAALALWYVLLVPVGITAGAVHLLLAIGVVLLVRWWALRAAGRDRGPPGPSQISQFENSTPDAGCSGHPSSVIRRSVQWLCHPSAMSAR
jgi:hypothetical protein